MTTPGIGTSRVRLGCDPLQWWRRAGTRVRKPNTRTTFLIAGMVLSASMIASVVLFIGQTHQRQREAQVEYGNAQVQALERQLVHGLATTDALLTTMCEVLENENGSDLRDNRAGMGPGSRRSINDALRRAPLVRSLSLLEPDGRVLFSTTLQVTGWLVDLPAFEFQRELGAELQPGRTRFGLDLDTPDLYVSGWARQLQTPHVIPMARMARLHGAPVIALAMVDTNALLAEFSAARRGQAHFAVLFDQRGRVLDASGETAFMLARTYGKLPMFTASQHLDREGQFLLSRPDDRNGSHPNLISFRATEKFPLVAAIGMPSQPVHENTETSLSRLSWLGIGAAAVAFLFTLMVWHRMVSGGEVQTAGTSLPTALPTPLAAVPARSPAAVTEPPLVLDHARLYDVFGAADATLHEILALFISSTRPMLENLAAAAAAGEFSRCAAIAHRLYGSCATVGCNELAALARDAEQAGWRHDPHLLQRTLSSLDAAFARACDAIHNLEGAP